MYPSEQTGVPNHPRNIGWCKLVNSCSLFYQHKDHTKSNTKRSLSRISEQRKLMNRYQSEAAAHIPMCCIHSTHYDSTFKILKGAVQHTVNFRLCITKLTTFIHEIFRRHFNFGYYINEMTPQIVRPMLEMLNLQHWFSNLADLKMPKQARKLTILILPSNFG